MKIKAPYLIASGFIALSVFGFVFVLMGGPGASEHPAGVFEKAGYLVLVPYVDQQPPGYFDTVEKASERAVSLHRTCDIPYSEIEPFIKRTGTVNEEITQKLKAGYDADASMLSIDGSVSLEGVKNVHVRFENSAIWFLTTESLYRIRDKYLHGACEAAIESDLRNGFSVCQTKKVVVSDIVFEVTYESGTVTKIAAPADSLSASANAAGMESHDINGRKMFHAVKLDDKACFSLNPSAT